MKKYLPSLFMFFLLMGYASAHHSDVIKLDPRGDDEYTLEFTNRQGTTYKLPYITNEGGTFKYGDNDKDLVFIEGNYSEGRDLRIYNGTIGNYTEFNIGILDYFVLSSGSEDNITTHIVRYNSIDIYDRTLSFDEEGSGTKEFTYEAYDPSTGEAIGKAHLIFGGNTYVTYVGNSTGFTNPLAVDMNADGLIDMAEIRVTTNAGGILDLGIANLSDGGTFTYAGDGQHTWSNVGRVIFPSSSGSPLQLLTKAGINHGLPPQDELIVTQFEQRSQNRLGIQFVNGSTFSFPGNSNSGRRLHLTPYTLGINFFDPEGNDDAETLTLEYNPSFTSLEAQGEAKIGETVNFTLRSPYHPNQHYLFMMSLGSQPGFNLTDGRHVALNPDSVFFTSLFSPLLLQLYQSQSRFDTEGQGQAFWSIPNNPSLVGFDVTFAYVIIDWGRPVPESILSISDPINLTLLPS